MKTTPAANKPFAFHRIRQRRSQTDGYTRSVSWHDLITHEVSPNPIQQTIIRGHPTAERTRWHLRRTDWLLALLLFINFGRLALDFTSTWQRSVNFTLSRQGLELHALCDECTCHVVLFWSVEDGWMDGWTGRNGNWEEERAESGHSSPANHSEPDNFPESFDRNSPWLKYSSEDK
jgi:hypothetical protein